MFDVMFVLLTSRAKVACFSSEKRILVGDKDDEALLREFIPEIEMPEYRFQVSQVCSELNFGFFHFSDVCLELKMIELLVLDRFGIRAELT